MSKKRVETAALTACAIVLTSAASRAADSSWAAKVGKILANDRTVACTLTPSVVPNGQGQNVVKLTATLNTLYTDGTQASAAGDGATTVAIKAQCLDVVTGQLMPSSLRSPASGFGTSPQSIQCGVNQLPVFGKCMLRSTDSSPFTYGSPDGYGGDPCADGVSGVTVPAGTNGYVGQITGQRLTLNFSNVNTQLFNYNTQTQTGPMKTAQVWGTDMGFTFYSQGKLWSGYGDTWANHEMLPIAPTNLRGSVLFSTQDLDPSNGLTFSSWVPNNTTWAAEVIDTCHGDNPLCTEGSAIPGAGFGLSDASNYYRVLWYAMFPPSPQPFTWIKSSMAWSQNNGPFTRGDLTPGAPLWASSNTSTHFGAGGIWQDRFGGHIYLFGRRVGGANASVRLARVPATFASVENAAAYQYWNGTGWQASESGITEAAALVPASVGAGAELSVVFNPHVNRFLMMLVRNRYTASEQTPPRIELWQALKPTGPWSLVATGQTLPNPDMNKDANGNWIGRYAASFWYAYGPYMGEQLMRNHGQNVYYQLSEWNGSPGWAGFIPNAGLPYNVGLWTYQVNRALAPQCIQ